MRSLVIYKFWYSLQTLKKSTKRKILCNLCFQLSKATTDDQLRAELTCDEVLDVLEKVGYSGIPQKETVVGIQHVIQ